LTVRLSGWRDGNRPDKSPHQTEPIRRRTQQAFLKSRDSTKMFRRSDFRNARPVRKGKSSWQNLIAVTIQMPMKSTPSNGRENKKGNTRHAPKRKPYVHATMKNEALLDA
jgi:hypothetical protein